MFPINLLNIRSPCYVCQVLSNHHAAQDTQSRLSTAPCLIADMILIKVLNCKLVRWNLPTCAAGYLSVSPAVWGEPSQFVNVEISDFTSCQGPPNATLVVVSGFGRTSQRWWIHCPPCSLKYCSAAFRAPRLHKDKFVKQNSCVRGLGWLGTPKNLMRRE